MSPTTEFDIDAIARESKQIRSFSVDLPEGLGDLARQSFLASSGFCPEDRIAAEMALQFDGQTLSMPVLTARGRKDGPTLVVTAGVHGDEYEGMEAIYRTYEALDPDRLKGTFVAVPIVTLTAFWLGIRCNPVDSRQHGPGVSGQRRRQLQPATGQGPAAAGVASCQLLHRPAQFGAQLSHVDALRLLHAGEAGRRRPGSRPRLWSPRWSGPIPPLLRGGPSRPPWTWASPLSIPRPMGPATCGPRTWTATPAGWPTC